MRVLFETLPIAKNARLERRKVARRALSATACQYAALADFRSCRHTRSPELSHCPQHHPGQPISTYGHSTHREHYLCLEHGRDVLRTLIGYLRSLRSHGQAKISLQSLRYKGPRHTLWAAPPLYGMSTFRFFNVTAR